jgi:hypothetical protein
MGPYWFYFNKVQDSAFHLHSEQKTGIVNFSY